MRLGDDRKDTAMGRHAPRSRVSGRTWVVVALTTVLALVAAVWVVTRPGAEDASEAAAGESSCSSTEQVRVAVAPDLGPLVDGLLADPVPYGDDGACADAVVRLQEPVQTIGDLQALDPGDQPQVWVPDDESWAVRAGDAVQRLGPLARTSVVLATSRAQAQQRGWTEQPPTWAGAVSAGLETPGGLLLGDPASEAESLSVLAAVPATLGAGAETDQLVDSVMLSTERGASLRSDGLRAAVSGDSAPVVVATEYQVAQAVAGGTGELVVVRPSPGSPSLLAPVVSTTAAEGSEAAAAVLDALVGADGAAVRAAGWRDVAGDPPVGADDGTGVSGTEAGRLALDPALLQGLLDQFTATVAPSRVLAVVDVSQSMAAAAGDTTRVGLASAALSSAMSVVPDRTIAALWIFARGLEGDQDWLELLPARSLDTQVGGQTQRQLLLDQVAGLDGRLSDGGTGLYDTVLAAVRSARAGYDPEATNSVVLLTDGANEDSGISEGDLLQTLAAEADPARPVQLIAIGLGPDADQAALQRIVATTGGNAYQASVAGDLQAVLFEALRAT